MDENSDTYGQHAATPDRPAGLPARVLGRDLIIPWFAFTHPGTASVARHEATWQHPAGMHLERGGVVHLEPFAAVRSMSRGRVDGVLPWSRLGALVRFGETPIKKLTSQD